MSNRDDDTHEIGARYMRDYQDWFWNGPDEFACDCSDQVLLAHARKDIVALICAVWKARSERDDLEKKLREHRSAAANSYAYLRGKFERLLREARGYVAEYACESYEGSTSGELLREIDCALDPEGVRG